MYLKSYVVLFAAILLIFSSCNDQKDNSNVPAEIRVIPAPLEIKSGTEYFFITRQTRITAQQDNDEAIRIANMFANKFNSASGYIIKVEESQSPNTNAVYFSLQGLENLGDEGYEITINKGEVIVSAFQPAGLFYGMQSLLQLLPPEIESKEVKGADWSLPVVSIKDKPRFQWRGLHLDVARHFMPVDFIKRYIDNMAMHKLNTFHWHLTEDQGWRIEIKKYPKLTEIGSKRKETLIGHNYHQPHKFDGLPYGGYYTQEEIKEIVQYARERFITVVPEIELPGHASAAIAAYPELGVTGKQIEVVSHWGIFPDIFNVEENTFRFLEDVLTEVMELFPSEYIHIGGDEAIKDQWKASARVQQQIKDLGLKDENELQSYFIKRIEKFINSKGRKMVGWEEILEGGLAPNAAVMSWKGEQAGIETAMMKHPVIMSPGQYLYFDHYQGNPSNEPLAIGGFTSLKKVYSYNPVPDSLPAEVKKFILGTQANVWTEYMKTPEHVEYMVFPRAAALAEVAWSENQNKNWESFISRLDQLLQRYEYRNINYSKSMYDVTITSQPDTSAGTMVIVLENELNEAEIRYTLEGTEPGPDSPVYKQPILLSEDKDIKAVLFKNGNKAGRISEQSFKVHKAFGKKVSYKYPYNTDKFLTTDYTLTNGISGTSKSMFSNLWQRFNGVDIDAIIDLGSLQPVSQITLSFANLPDYRILPSKSLEIFLSEDGSTYTKAVDKSNVKSDSLNPVVVKHFLQLKGGPTRYVKVVARHNGLVPTKTGQLQPSVLMIDEIVVE
ncbi:MAG: beta-N-acetylhexosaminidase [Cytophagaceae bacterium]